MKKLSVKQLARIQTVFYVLAAVFAIISYMTETNGGSRPLLWIAGILIVISIAMRFIFVKCPSCGDSLSGSKKIPDICPNCGFDLINNMPKENENGQNN